MVMLAEHYDFVIGGDPDRDTIDLAIVTAATGRVGGHRSDRTDGPGYVRLLAWAREHACGRRVWALESTGSFAAGLVTVLAQAGEDVWRSPAGNVLAAPRTTGSTQSELLAPRWPRSSTPHRGNEVYAKRYVRSSSPGRRSWSAAPRRSTS
jgi:hypothetical protein